MSQKLGAQLLTAYGQSEGNNISCTRADTTAEEISRTDGRIHDSIAWKLVDPDGATVPRGARGEFVHRGPNVCLGYLDPAHAARAFDAEGYLHSGDLAEIDDQNNIRIVGRRKDIIIRGGKNISPAEIENLLFRHPDVAEICIAGVPDDRLGQRICAFVVPRDVGRGVTLEALTGFLAARGMARFKHPEFLRLLGSLPRSVIGKVQRERLVGDFTHSGR